MPSETPQMRTPGKVWMRVPLDRIENALLVVQFVGDTARLDLSTRQVLIDGSPRKFKTYANLRPPMIVVPLEVDETTGRDSVTLEIIQSDGPLVEDHLSLLVLDAENTIPAPSFKSDGRGRAQSRFSRRGIRKFSEFPLSHFDGIEYLKHYADVESAVREGTIASAAEHFVLRAEHEVRQVFLATGAPNRGDLRDLVRFRFDGLKYLDRYPDVREAVQAGRMESALTHFLERGEAEGRVAFQINPNIAFAGTLSELKLSRSTATGAQVSRAKTANTPREQVKGGRNLNDLAANTQVTIVIPTYNSHETIATTIDSLKRQTNGDFDCIVVDDASSDGSGDVAIEAIGGDSRFEVIRLGRNSGLSGARNAGLLCTNTEYVIFLDADDVLLPWAIEQRMAQLRNRTGPKNVAGVFSGVVKVPSDIDLEEAYAAKPSPTPAIDLGRAMTAASRLGSSQLCIHQVTMRTSVAKLAGGFDESLHGGAEDFQFWSRIFAGGYIFWGTPLVDALYLQYPKSMLRSDPLGRAANATLTHLRNAVAVQRQQQKGELPRVPDGGLVPITNLARGIEDKPLVERALIFIGFGVASGNEDLVSECLALLEKCDPSVAAAEASFVGYITGGVTRALSGDKGLSWDRRDLLIEDALARVNDRLPNLMQRAPRSLPAARPVVLAASAAEARSFHDALADPTSVDWVTIEGIEPDQGASTYLSDHEIACQSLVEFLLIPRNLSVVAVHSMTCLTSESVMQTLNRSNVATLRVRFDWTISRANHSQGSISIARQIDASELAEELEINRAHSVKRGYPPIVTEIFEPLHTGDPADAPQTHGSYPDVALIQSLKNAYRGRTCVIIGNGPRPAKTELAKLAGIHTLVCNEFCFVSDELPQPPAFYFVDDRELAHKHEDAIRAVGAGLTLFPTAFRQMLTEAEADAFFRLDSGLSESGSLDTLPRFSVDPSERVFGSQSQISISLQFAYYLGFTNVVLLAVDAESSTVHSLAREMFEIAGQTIVNATNGATVDAYERMSLDVGLGR